jgi:predicted ATPase/transcriptional regulator with XRE-family HTH domain
MTGHPPSPFGVLLRRLREAAGLTQEALAERAELSYRTVSDLERGINRSPRADGARRLADALGLTGPERAHFLAVVRAAAIGPAAIAPETPTTGAPLPIAPTPLVGRASELAAIVALLQRSDIAIVTLTGAGGTGKTRLAIEVASSLRAAFPDGVSFVDLAPLVDPSLVISSLARRLGVDQPAGQSLLDGLIACLAGRRLLLVLDNFEHLLPAASTIATLVAHCPALKILVTSRAPLRLHGEHVFSVPPLQLPDLDRLPPLATLAATESLALLTQRARAIRLDFALTPANARPLAEICVRLDGLPLAIELAAARTRLLSPQDILSRLDDRLTLLQDAAPDLPARQRTLRDTVAWSYDLLAPQTRELFQRLAVFAGGATLPAIAAVCGAAAPASDVLDEIGVLVDHSLLRQESAGNGEPRFAMLETLREFGLDRLRASGKEETTRHAHAAYFLALAEAADRSLAGPDQPHWLARLEADHDNLRVALAWTIDHGDGMVGLRLASALWWFWETRGHYEEGRGWLGSALAAGSTELGPHRAKALFGAGVMTYRQGDTDSATALQEEALACFRALGDRQGAAWSLAFLGLIANARGELARAAALHTESLSLARALDDRLVIAGSLSNLGEVELSRGDLARAAALFEEALDIGLELGNLLSVARTFDNLGRVALGRGDLVRAGEMFRAGLAMFWMLGDRRGIASSLEGLAAVAATGQPSQAALLFGVAAALREAIRAPLPAPERIAYDRGLTLTRAQLDEDDFAAAFARGGTFALDRVVKAVLEARSLPDRSLPRRPHRSARRRMRRTGKATVASPVRKSS